MEIHPIALLLPVMGESELNNLKNDIQTNGLLHPISLYEEKILDGRHRYTACTQLGIEPQYTQYTGTNPVSFVISTNINRRHLNESQRALLALELVPELEKEAEKRMKAGVVNPSAPVREGRKTSEQAGEAVGVGSRTIEMAKKIATDAPNRLAAIREGKSTVGEVYRDMTRERKRKEYEALPDVSVPTGTFDIVYADPPWRYEEASASPNRAIENQYQTMEVEDIMAIHIPSNEDSLLLLWATAPKLIEALQVMEAWGYKYRTNIVWDKQKIGMGYWARGQHEILLIGVKGEFSPPQVEDRISSIYSEKRTEHSKKPEFFYHWIEKCWKGKTKLEMFAREARKGWEVFGNQL